MTGLREVRNKVVDILREYPESRNSDLYLTILYLRKYTELGKYIRFIPYDVIKKYDGLLESIRRSRQYIQNTLGLYPPTDPEVVRKRKLKEKRIKKTIGAKKL